MFLKLKTAAIVLLLSVAFMLSTDADAAIMPLGDTGQYSSSVQSDNGWTNHLGTGEVDFWTLTLTEEKKLSVSVLSNIVFGFSLYRGELVLDPAILFANYTHFSGFAGEYLTYLTGTDPFTPLSGGTLVDFLLPAGIYTLAVGGNDAGFDPVGSYSYQLDVLMQPTIQVSTPATAMLLLLSFAILIRRQRRC